MSEFRYVSRKNLVTGYQMAGGTTLYMHCCAYFDALPVVCLPADAASGMPYLSIKGEVPTPAAWP